jgi:hypothetical protein
MHNRHGQIGLHNAHQRASRQIHASNVILPTNADITKSHQQWPAERIPTHDGGQCEKAPQTITSNVKGLTQNEQRGHPKHQTNSTTGSSSTTDQQHFLLHNHG